MWPRLTRDFNRMKEIKGWGAAHTLVDALLLDNGFQALIAYRMASTFRRWGVPFVPALCRRLSIAFCGIDILPQAEIGGGCYIPHGVGLVVGGATVIGDDCTLLQGVTLGEARFDETSCPRVGDRVTLGAGAKILGGITVGDDSFIGAGAVVLEDVPPQHIAIGVPARIKPVS
jgi:serine O-acetyltransferase